MHVGTKEPEPKIAASADTPQGLAFKAIRISEAGRVSYIGVVPIVELITRGLIAPAASAGLSPDVLSLVPPRGSVQRKTTASHVQGIVDYIVSQAELGEPWAFNSIVLYSTAPLRFTGISEGAGGAGDVHLGQVLSVGEGLHRSLAWAIASGASKSPGVRRPSVTAPAQKRIERALIPAIVIEEHDLHRQHVDFNKLNQQRPLTATVLSLTDNSELSELTRQLIHDVALFNDRIELNNAGISANSDKLLSFSQLRFVIASYLFGAKTRSKNTIEMGVNEIVRARGRDQVRSELRDLFTLLATQLGGLERLHRNQTPTGQPAEFVRTLRRETILASNATWRALAIALHNAKDAGLDPATAIENLKQNERLNWTRNSVFFRGTLLELNPETQEPTGKLLSSRESIDAAAAKLHAAMLKTPQPNTTNHAEKKL